MARLAETALDGYARDGAAVLRSVVDLDWIERLRTEFDVLMADGSHGRNMGRDGEGRFFGDSFLWLRSPVLVAFLRESRLGALAAEFMRSSEVRFFMDQLLVKEPGALKRTPWHQDQLYWPVSSGQILSFWIPLDAATPETGVVTYVRGSHRWGRLLESGPFAEDEENTCSAKAAITDDAEPPHHTLGDIRARPDRYSFLSWDVKPGDIVHHPLVVHGATGNMSADRRRRAWATRWMDESVRWDDSRPHFLERYASDPSFPYPRLSRGDLLRDDRIFPVLWNATAE